MYLIIMNLSSIINFIVQNDLCRHKMFKYLKKMIFDNKLVYTLVHDYYFLVIQFNNK